MKVITQLIRHFWQRGALTPEQAEYLLDQGFARLADLPGYQSPPEAAGVVVATTTIERPSPLEEIGERLDRPRKRGKGGPKGVVPEENDLRLWLNKQFARRSRAFASLVTFARRFAPCATWQNAVVTLRQVRPDRFHKGLASALRSQEFGLRTFWTAVDPEPFHARMEDSSLRGPTVRAFRMLLALRSAPQMGRYVWILKLAEVQAALNLLTVHRLLLRALGELFRQHRPTLNAALQHSSHPVPRWALVLLYNAGRRPRGYGAVHRHEYGPVELPDESTWQQAWTGALVMDPRPITRLLVRCYGLGRAGDRAACGESLYCPLGWKV
jgi:hypothetical protein